MSEPLPFFPYYPNALEDGALLPSQDPCGCCQRVRGYLYYAELDLPDSPDVEVYVCPWCIADGSAARTFDYHFNWVDELASAGVSAAAIEEVNLRTPSYSSWQDIVWLSHCGDACEFHGDATVDDVRNASPETLVEFLKGQDEFIEHWTTTFASYELTPDLVIYKYICRHCRLVLFMYEYS